MTHEFDGRVKFVSHPSVGEVEVLLEIDQHGRVIGDVVAGLRRWLDATAGEPTVEVPTETGDFFFGVPAAERVLGIHSDGRVTVGGSEIANDTSLHRRFAAWFGACRLTLPDGRKASVTLTDSAAPDRNFYFTSGRGAGRPGRGGDVVLTAGAKRAKSA